jgi:sarcosine oxidase subunit beta
MGVSIALELQERGQKTIVVEKGVMGGEASGRNGGGVRAQGRHGEEIPLALLSIRLWEGMNKRLGRDVAYSKTGHIYIAENESDLAMLEKMKAEEAKFGLQSELIGANKLAELAPGLKPGYPGAKYCPTDGAAEPAEATTAIGLAFEALGGRILTNQEAKAIDVVNRRVAGVETTDYTIAAPVVVNAAGPWAPLIAHMTGNYLPIYPRRNNMSYTEPMPRQVHCFTQSAKQGMAIRQLPGGNIMLSGAPQPHGNSPFTFSKDYFGVELKDSPRLAKVEEMFPAVAHAKIIGRWVGITENTPDKMPIIDRLGADIGGADGLFVAAGFSGHGFCLGPGVGRMMAEWIVDGAPSLDMSHFRYMRFMAPPSPWSSDVAQYQHAG